MVGDLIPILYPATERRFENNGLGGLPHAKSCVVVQKRNTSGGYYLEMEYPVNGLHYKDLACERIIYAAPEPGKHPQPFCIDYISRPINGIVKINAQHPSAQLQKLVTYGTYSGTDIQGMCNNYLLQARQLGQNVEFWFTTDITSSVAVTFKHPEPSSVMDVLLGKEGSVLDMVGGEYEFDGWHIILHAQRGVDSGIEVRYGVNMTDFDAETDASDLVTAVLPYWKGTVNDVETYVIGDLCVSSNAAAFATTRAVPVDVSNRFDSDQAPTETQVTAAGQAYISSSDSTRLVTSIKTAFSPAVIGNRPLHLCDTVRIVHPDMGVSATATVVETRHNVLTDKYESVTVGGIRKTIVQTIAELIKRGG